METMSNWSEKKWGEFDKKVRPLVINNLKAKFGLNGYEAQEVWQEANLVFFTKLNNGTLAAIPENPTGFLWKACINKVYELWREKVRQYMNREKDMDFMVQMMDSTYQRKLLLEYELAERGIDMLAERKAALVRGFYLEGKSMSQLAEELGFKDADVAKNTKKRVMEELKEIVKNHDLLHVYDHLTMAA